MDVGLRHEIVAEQKRQGKYIKPVKQLSEEEMKALIERTRKDD